MTKKKIKKVKILIIFLSTLISSFYLLLKYYQENTNQELLVSFINCSQADAIFLKTPYGQQIIIDFGSNQGLKDLNKRIPWWDKTIDLMIITHPHDDHIAGMKSIIERYEVKNIMYTGIISDSPIYLDLLNTVEERNIPLLIPKPQQKISFGDSCNLDIIYPIKSLANKEISNLNNSSIVSRLDCAGTSFLFVGDAEIEEENEILQTKVKLQSDILKVGHHGSITSSQLDFLNQVQAKIAIIMVGQNNSFNHPSLRTIEKLKRLNYQIFRTDLDGTIDIKINEHGLDIKKQGI